MTIPNTQLLYTLELDAQGKIIDASENLNPIFSKLLKNQDEITPNQVKLLIEKMSVDTWSELLFKDKTILNIIFKKTKENGNTTVLSTPIYVDKNTAIETSIFAVELNTSEIEDIPLKNAKPSNNKHGYKLFIQTISKNNTNFEINQIKEQHIWQQIWNIALSEFSTQNIAQEILNIVGEFIKAKQILIIEQEENNHKMCYEWSNPQQTYCEENQTTKRDMVNNQTPYCFHKQKLDTPLLIEFITSHKKTYYLSDHKLLTKHNNKAFKNLDVECLWIFPYHTTPTAYSKQQKTLYIIFEHSIKQEKWTKKEQEFLTKTAHFIAVFISLKRKALQAQSYKKALKELLSLAESGICLINKKSGTILYSNTMFNLLIGDEIKPSSKINNYFDLNVLYNEYAKQKIERQNNQQNSINNTNPDLTFECFFPERVRWVFASCFELFSEKLNDKSNELLIIYLLDITSQKEEYAVRQRLATIDRSSGALYLQFGLNLLDEITKKTDTTETSLTLACISFDNYHFLDKSNNPEYDNEMLAFVVRTIKMRKVDYEIIRTNLNELIICMQNVSLENAQEFFAELPDMLKKDAGFSYSDYELKFSLGYAESNYKNRKNSLELLLEAKRNLYSLKNKKKNKANFLLI
ncbi:diguanylate cyclase [Desulfovibrio litoralis]|uniref:GGDEF domain-containing protein, diguanylate cyclase (C-di-GMP synthetase) or its enzymatically inactive variants n=1 Tax=Desulfovibrio litoralis DSM 11393 TaxID=1121455 RepID=A0A1M7RRN1_9BACT|nr:diguanylate cyclase [Desulfovibrio litoralis]SHN48756.1 GGDEF domain-containing protein, diguanylate cyclase (c-di-GMP synthetase) or its enzymatically inactive variants [Desulfovibrio litoralis DSM 11393]